jgi:hypothetical protein
MSRKFSYPSNRTITGLLARLIITFGLALIMAGLYFMIVYVRASTQSGQTDLAANSAVSALDWIPGIPFYTGDLANFSFAAIGLVSWILGISLVLVGLGLRAKHTLARLAALAIFASAAFFQFIQFLLLGILGSPTSVIELCADGVIVYFLLSRFG